MTDLAPESEPSPTLERDPPTAVIGLAGEGPDLERAAAALGAGVTRVTDAGRLAAGLEGAAADVLVLAGAGALDLCRGVRARVELLAQPILVLGAPLADALAAGANDGLDGGWEAAELALRVGALACARRLHAEALAEAREESRESELALDVFARAGAALTTSFDVRACIAALVRVAVPELSDFCGVYLVGDHGEVRLAEAFALDPEHVRIARARIAQPGADHCRSRPVMEVVRTGRSVLRREVTDADYVAMATDAEDLAALRRKATNSWLCVPLSTRGRTVGALVLCLCRSPRRYDEADLALAEELGRRAAVAIDNAQLFALAERERRAAEHANQLKDEFLSNLSHELRTPLTAILGWARILRTHALPDDKRTRAIETIERNATLQARLIDDLLDASRILAGTLAIEIAPVDLAQVVGAALAAARDRAEAKGLRLRGVIDPGVRLIPGDAGRLEHVVEALLSNALKFTPEGGAVDVRLERDGEAGAQISVADTGVGIGPDFLPHVFERFRQADGSMTRMHGGLGLGLTLARHLVELHGGTLDAYSEGEGRGATFTVRLPVAKG
jgi:signal transduction histidine kinase